MKSSMWKRSSSKRTVDGKREGWVMTQRRWLEKSILFLGMDQSCSGQIAEDIATSRAPPDTRVFSAALGPREGPPAAVEVMREVEVEMSTERAKALDSVP